MRAWSQELFTKHQVISRDMYKLLNEVKNPQASSGDHSEFDLLCKILRVFEKDENSIELRIKDISQV